MAAQENVVEMPRKSNASGNEGMGVVLEFAIAKGQNLQLSTCLTQSDSLHVWNETLDKMRKAGERQALIQGIEECERANIYQRQQKADAEEDEDRNSKEFSAGILAAQAQSDELNRMKDRISTADQESFTGGSRRGEYKVSAAASAKMREIDSKLVRLGEDLEKADQRRKEQVRDHQSNVNSFVKTIALNQGEIDRAKIKLDSLQE